MSKSVELYQDTSEAGTTKTLTRFTPSEDLVIFPAIFTTLGGVGTLGVNIALNNADPFSAAVSMLAAAGILGYGSFKSMYFTSFKNRLDSDLSTVKINMHVQPSLFDVKRTRKEKRMIIAENATSRIYPDNKVTLTLVTNKEGVWIEEKVKASPMKSWDKVLESLIKVHQLETIDAIASATVPEVSADGSKLSWKDKVGNLLSDAGIIQVCQKRDCATNCKHIF